MSTTTPALVVEGLGKSFSGVHAVHGVDFTINRGETLSIIGPNGSGKTTTLNLVTGTLVPDAGSVLLAGRQIAGHSPEEVAEHGLTRTFQNGRVFGNLTVTENIAVGQHRELVAQRPLTRWANVPVLKWFSLLGELAAALVTTPAIRAERVAMAKGVAAQVGRFEARLGPRVEHLSHTLSYAHRRRTEIARALVSNPDLLVLDEPTAGMNQSETAEVKQQLRDLKQSGQTMLLVEHKLDLVMSLSDRVIVMDEGRIIAHGSPDQVRKDPRVISAYLGRRHAHADKDCDE